MAFDEIYEYTGGFGLYQIGLFILLGLATLLSGVQDMAMIFMAPEQDHWCKVDRLQNLSEDMQKYIAIPEDDKCHYYNLPYDNLSDTELENWNWTNALSPVYSDKVRCDQWVFDQLEYQNTAVTKYSLVCEQSYLVSLVNSSVVAATLTAYLFGFLSDTFGRKKVLIALSVVAGPFALAAAFAPNYLCFLLFRFLMMVSSVGISTCSSVLLMEITGPQYRSILSGIFWVFWSLGSMCLPIFAFFNKDFQTLQIVLAVPMFISIVHIFVIPESPRWLYSRQRFTEIIEVIKVMSRFNRKVIDSDSMSKIEETLFAKIGETEKCNNKRKRQNILDILRTSILRRYLFLLMPGVISISVLYYSFSFNMGTLAGNVYINTFLSGLSEIPSYLVNLCMYRFGRRLSSSVPLIFAGVACYVSIPFLVSGKDNLQFAVTAFVLLGKSLLSASFIVLYIYVAELFPTTVRQVAISFLSIVALGFSLLAPFMGKPLMDIWVPLPILFYGTLGMVSGVLLLLLPETKDTRLPDDISEVVGVNIQKEKTYINVSSNLHPDPMDDKAEDT